MNLNVELSNNIQDSRNNSLDTDFQKHKTTLWR